MRKIALFALALLVLISAGRSGRSQITSRDRILRAVDATEVATVRGTAHPLARPQFDQGRKDPGDMIHGSITFRLSSAQQADLERLLQDQQDPSSPNYHRWLTPEQYAARFGMSSSDLAKVSSWLQSQGLNVEEISRNHNEISFSGSVGQVEYAFKTELHKYVVKGEQHFANAKDVSLPAAFSAEVLGVRGLNDFRPKPRAKPGPRFTSNLSGNHFVIPGDFWTIYDVPNATYDGTGQKIAVAGQTAINLSDIDAFRAASGLAKNDPTVQCVPNTGNCAVVSSGDLSEADLDTEWAGGIAPGATIVYVTVGNNTSFSVFDALHYAVQNNVAPVISISYGDCESDMGSSTTLMFQQWAQQANAQGQTISGPSGDSGAADCDLTVSTHGYQVDVPASIPEVTGVGGTQFTGDGGTCASSCPGNVAPADLPYWSGSSSLTSGASALQYIPEMGWNDTSPGNLSASGGGASIFFGKPTWQTGAGVPADGKRDVPDIALSADPSHDPYLICSGGDCVSGFRDSSNNLDAVGGTSVGAPIFAGIVAIINQATAAPAGQGNANPTLYSLAGTTVFNDITSGNNSVPCTSGTTDCPAGTTTIGFNAGPGYDQVTGLGSPNISTLISAWPGLSKAQAFNIGVSPLSVTVSAGQSASAGIAVSGTNGFSGAVALSCSIASTPAGASCSINPSSINLGTSTPSGPATLNIKTAAASAALTKHELTFIASLLVFPGVAIFLLPKGTRKAKLLGLTTLCIFGFGLACGGGSSNSTQQKSPGTPAGTYVVTVTGTSGSTTHTATVSVTVQ